MAQYDQSSHHVLLRLLRASLINNSNTPNHVFNDPNLDLLKELMVKCNSLFKVDEPLIAAIHDLETIDYPFWGIKAG